MEIDPTRAPCPLRAAALASPRALAVVGPEGELSYGELDRRVSAAAENFESLGSGARVALYLPKDERYIVLLLALIRGGYVACPVSDRLPLRGVAQLLEKVACRALISNDDIILGAAGENAEKLRPQDVLGGAAQPSRLPPLEPLPLSAPATIVFTSGSTGVPKAVLHTFGNHYYSALGSNANIALGLGDRWLHSLPLYHVGGLSIVFRCLLAGATVVLVRPGATLGDAIDGSGATHVSLVATQLLRLLGEGADLRSLKAILLGGGPMPVHLLDKALTRGLPIHTSYGLTEMASQVTTTPAGASREELCTAGRPLPHRDLSVSRDAEILVRGETLFSGYVEGGVIERSLDAEGWFHTRDLGELSADGYLRVWGRKDNLFISGGENIQPEEIEEALRRLEGIEEAVVVPIPDDEFGHRPVAFVRTAGGGLQPEEYARALEATLPRFKIPVAFHRWSEGVGEMKVDRTFYRERARRLHGRG